MENLINQEIHTIDSTAKTALMKTPEQVHFVTGLGLKDEELPLRLPAVITPALEIMKKSLHQIPHYTIYQATDFIIKQNNLDEEKALDVAATMQHYIERFVAVFYPEIADHVEIKFNLPYNEDLQSEIQKTQQAIQASLSKDHKQVLNQNAQKHAGDSNQYLDYLAANVVLNGGGEQFLFEKPDKPIIVPIGGKKERPFFEATVKHNHGGRNIKPVIIRNGKIPTYYQADKDVTTVSQLKDYIHHQHPVSRDVRRDLNHLVDLGLPDKLTQIF